MTLDFHAEEVSEYGGITGDGLGNLLGAPRLEPLELLVREAVQNSWDARLEGAETVEFGLRYKALRPHQRSALFQQVLHSTPPRLAYLADQDRVSALYVWDRGTRGLAGPIRTNEPGERRDFVNFVYMIGETKDQRDHTNTHAGGTYGYGRSAFFRASKIRTVLVHSRVAEPTGLESRFIGISWIQKYGGGDGILRTGRHWWGRLRGDWLGPVTGSQADEVAESLGFPLPPPGETGTTIMVLEPVLPATESDDDASPLVEAREQVVSTLLWNCWPRMVAGGLSFRVEWDGSPIHVPDPADHPRIKSFVRAFDVLRGTRTPTQMARTFDIELLNPITHLGKLGIARSPFIKGGNEPDPASPVDKDSPLRHVALMRNTLLVLKYFEPPGVPPRDGEQYSGIFISDRRVEDAFARSEPPSHDDWVRERLTDPTERKYVNVGLRRIKEKTAEFISPAVRLPGSSWQGSLAGVADSLGTLLPGLTEDARGASMERSGGSGGGSGGGGRSPSVNLRPVIRVPRDEAVELEIPFSVSHVPDTSGSRVTVEVSVRIAGGAKEKEPPEGRGRPCIMGWTTGGSEVTPVDGSLQIAEIDVPQELSEGVVRILQPEDCTVDINVSAAQLEGA